MRERPKALPVLGATAIALELVACSSPKPEPGPTVIKTETRTVTATPAASSPGPRISESPSPSAIPGTSGENSCLRPSKADKRGLSWQGPQIVWVDDQHGAIVATDRSNPAPQAVKVTFPDGGSFTVGGVATGPDGKQHRQADVVGLIGTNDIPEPVRIAGIDGTIGEWGACEIPDLPDEVKLTKNDVQSRTNDASRYFTLVTGRFVEVSATAHKITNIVPQANQ